MSTWRSEDNLQQSVSSMHPVGPEIQVVRLGGKCFPSLNHTRGLEPFFFSAACLQTRKETSPFPPFRSIDSKVSMNFM